MSRGPGSTWSRTARRSVLTFAPVLVYGTYTRYPSLSILPFLALVPWVILYTDRRPGKVSAGWFALGAWTMWVVNYWPQTSQYGWYAPPAMAAFFFVPWVAFPFLIRPIVRRFDLPRALVFPIVWVALEWIRAEFSLSHFDLHFLGYSQGRATPLIQISDLTGVYGVSFLVAAVNGWLADAWFAARDGGGFRAAFADRRVRVSAAAILAGFVAFGGYGVWRLASARHEPGPRIAVVQPNIRHTIRNAVGVHLGQILLTDRLVPSGSADLIVWPENAILDNLRREGAYLDDVAWLGARKQAWILLGAMGKSVESPGRTSNSAFLADPEGNLRGEYRKQMLYPWSEYIPFDDALRRFAPPLWRAHRNLIRKAWGYLAPGTAGDETTLLTLPWGGGTIPMGIVICVENVYPPIPADAARRGARLFMNLTSEGQAEGIGIQEQLLRISMLRAVENRIPYVRCGNTGISAFIDPEGRIRNVLRGERGQAISDAGVLIDRPLLSPHSGPTPYARSHDGFALVCLAATLLMAAAGTLRRAGGAARAIALGLAALVASSCGVALDGDPIAAVERGRGLLSEGRHREAARVLASACEEERACGEALPLLAEAFRATEEAERAADFFGAVPERHPALSATAWSMRGFFLEKGLDFAGAARDYERSLALEPTARVWALLGALRLRLDDFAGAADAFAEALRLDPSDPQSRYRWNRARWLHGDEAAARDDMERAVKEHPDHAPSWTLLGRLRERNGDDTGAEVAWRRAVLADKTHIEARFMLARRALRAGRMEEARTWLAEIASIEAGLGRGLSEG